MKEGFRTAMENELNYERLLRNAFINIKAQQYTHIMNHLHSVMQNNENINLTRINGEAEGFQYHVIDSLSVVSEVDECLQGKLLDLGTGAGYPGVPLAIATGRDTYLIDSTKKKTDLLDAFVKQEGLETHIHVVNARVEDYCLDHRGEYAVVIARAVSKLASLLELASPLLMTGGRLIAMKGDPDDSELKGAELTCKKVGMGFVARRDYELGDDRRHRSVFSYVKISDPEIQLPRRVGKAQKRPLF